MLFIQNNILKHYHICLNTALYNFSVVSDSRVEKAFLVKGGLIYSNVYMIEQ